MITYEAKQKSKFISSNFEIAFRYSHLLLSLEEQASTFSEKRRKLSLGGSKTH